MIQDSLFFKYPSKIRGRLFACLTVIQSREFYRTQLNEILQKMAYYIPGSDTSLYMFRHPSPMQDGGPFSDVSTGQIYEISMF